MTSDLFAAVGDVIPVGFTILAVLAVVFGLNIPGGVRETPRSATAHGRTEPGSPLTHVRTLSRPFDWERD